MKRLIFFVVAFCVFGAFSATAGKQQQAAKNIVLILADDMGFHMSATGTPGIRTPHLDRLAEEGTLLTNAFSVCSSCSPSRSSILTGMYPHANGHWRNTFGPKLSDPAKEFTRASEQADIVGVHEWVQTLPEIMNEAGYYTAIMKKFHLSYPWKYPFSGRYPTKSTPEAYEADIRKIIEDAGEKPFFIQANISSPHRPLKPFAQQYQGTWPEKAELELFPWLPDLDPVRQDLLYYYVSVMFTDQLTGRILEALKASGKGEETLVIFTSDHGPPFHRAKASAYYAAAHVPLIISGKGLPEGQVNEELVSLIDLLPTMFEYAGIPVPAQVQGKSLLPLVRDGKRELEGRDFIFVEHNSHGPGWAEFYPSRAVFDGNSYLIKNLMPEKSYKLPADLYQGEKPWGNLSYPGIVENREQVPRFYRSIVNLEGNRPPWELYDMKKDPGQMKNVYGLPAYEPVRKKLQQALENWQKQTGDTVLNEMVQTFKMTQF